MSDPIRITLTADRKLLAIETEAFRIKLNGKSNNDYKRMLDAFDIKLEFTEEYPGQVARQLDV
jgi:hypothetical protein